MIVRAEGTEIAGELTDDGVLIADVASLGLGVGDPVDLTLRADL